MSTAVLCVHGIQGSPDQFDWLIAGLPKDAHVENILLPGHGGDVRAFARSTRAHWQACVDDHLRRLRENYDRIVYIGHSMGCLLGIQAQLRLDCIDSMILLACPLKIRFTWRYVRNNLLAISKRESTDPFVLAARRLHSVKARYGWEYLLCAGPYLHLFSLMNSTNKCLSALNLPILAVFSDRDEIVSRKSLEKIGALLCCETYLAKNCGHMHYPCDERMRILAKMKRYIETESVRI